MPALSTFTGETRRPEEQTHSADTLNLVHDEPDGVPSCRGEACPTVDQRGRPDTSTSSRQEATRRQGKKKAGSRLLVPGGPGQQILPHLPEDQARTSAQADRSTEAAPGTVAEMDRGQLQMTRPQWRRECAEANQRRLESPAGSGGLPGRAEAEPGQGCSLVHRGETRDAGASRGQAAAARPTTLTRVTSC